MRCTYSWVTALYGHSWHIFDNGTRQLVIVFIKPWFKGKNITIKSMNAWKKKVKSPVKPVLRGHLCSQTCINRSPLYSQICIKRSPLYSQICIKRSPLYSQTCIKRSHLWRRKSGHIRGSIHIEIFYDR